MIDNTVPHLSNLPLTGRSEKTAKGAHGGEDCPELSQKSCIQGDKSDFKKKNQDEKMKHHHYLQKDIKKKCSSRTPL